MRLMPGSSVELVTRRRGLHHRAPTPDRITAMLERLSQTLPQLTHWDIRPARTVSLLGSRAAFLTGGAVEDEGRAHLGDLTLPALEKLAEAWAHELDPHWIEAKQEVSQRSAGGRDIPDYLGSGAVQDAFARQSPDAVEEVRGRMQALLDRCRAHSEGRPIDVLDRVAVVFEGGGV